jgi:hypothetical protein
MITALVPEWRKFAKFADVDMDHRNRLGEMQKWRRRAGEPV